MPRSVTQAATNTATKKASPPKPANPAKKRLPPGALQEKKIKFYQKKSIEVRRLAEAPNRRMILGIMAKFIHPRVSVRIKGNALSLIFAYIEKYGAEIFNKGQYVAEHAKRKMVNEGDVNIFAYLKEGVPIADIRLAPEVPQDPNEHKRHPWLIYQDPHDKEDAYMRVAMKKNAGWAKELAEQEAEKEAEKERKLAEKLERQAQRKQEKKKKVAKKKKPETEQEQQQA